MKHTHLFLVCMTLAAANFVSGQVFVVDEFVTADVINWSNNVPLAPETIKVGNGNLNTLGISATEGFFSYETQITGTADDKMVRLFKPAVGLTSANWTASVYTSLSVSTTLKEKAALFLTANLNSGHSYTIALVSNAGTAIYANRDNTTSLGTSGSLGASTLTIAYDAATTTLSFKNGATSFGTPYNVSSDGIGPGSFFTFELGGASGYDAGGSVLTITQASQSAYFDNFTLDGAGIIAAGGPPVPEPSTYAAIMGVAALGAAAIRRRRKSNTTA